MKKTIGAKSFAARAFAAGALRGLGLVIARRLCVVGRDNRVSVVGRDYRRVSVPAPAEQTC